MNNGNKDNIKNDIPIIKIDDSCAYRTGKKTVACIVIEIEGGNKYYKISRTGTGKYLMQ